MTTIAIEDVYAGSGSILVKEVTWNVFVTLLQCGPGDEARDTVARLREPFVYQHYYLGELATCM